MVTVFADLVLTVFTYRPHVRCPPNTGDGTGETGFGMAVPRSRLKGPSEPRHAGFGVGVFPSFRLKEEAFLVEKRTPLFGLCPDEVATLGLPPSTASCSLRNTPAQRGPECAQRELRDLPLPACPVFRLPAAGRQTKRRDCVVRFLKRHDFSDVPLGPP